MLENPENQILLLSHHPADASFLAEISVSQQVRLDLAVNEDDLIAKIASARKSDSLAAVFVDVSSPDQLRKFEFALQSKLGSGPAIEVARLVHFISGEPLVSNRELMQSPYFSTVSERKPYDYQGSARFYEWSYAPIGEFLRSSKMAFDQGTRDQCLEWLKKEILPKGCSIEWTLQFLKVLDEVIESSMPARFDVSTGFSDGVITLSFTAREPADRDTFRADRILQTGVSVIHSERGTVLLFPVFPQPSDAQKAFRFYKVEK